MRKWNGQGPAGAGVKGDGEQRSGRRLGFPFFAVFCFLLCVLLFFLNASLPAVSHCGISTNISQLYTRGERMCVCVVRACAVLIHFIAYISGQCLEKAQDVALSPSRSLFPSSFGHCPKIDD